MMRPIVVNTRRAEQVDLSPGGATIGITTQAENPFEDQGEIEVVTQESGGMAGPDPRQTSRGRRRTASRMGQAKRGGKSVAIVPTSRVPALRVSAAAARPLPGAGFLPGMGALSPMPRRVRPQPRRVNPAAGFLPGMGGLSDDGADIAEMLLSRSGVSGDFLPGLGEPPAGGIPASFSAAPARPGVDYGGMAKTFAETAASIGTNLTQAELVKRQAQLAEQEARKAGYETQRQGLLSAPMQTIANNPIPTAAIIAGVIGIGVVAFLLLNKKS